MHQDDMTVSTSACLLDAALPLRNSIVAPVSRIDIPRYDLAPELGHD
jgi:hypothetical protein